MMNDFYLLCAFFLIYSCLGWCVEVAYHAVTFGTIVNRGFLNGPVCPIYGFGMLAVIVLLLPMEENLLVLFLGGMCLTSAIELFGGWALDKLFHMRWWDYTDEPFNLGGYVCLKFSLMWGIGCVLMVRVIHPLVSALMEIIPSMIGIWGMVILYCLYAVDTVATVLVVNGLSHDLEKLDHITGELREISDRMTERIAKTAIATDQRIDEQRVQAALAKAEAKDAAERIQNEARENVAEMRNKLMMVSIEVEKEAEKDPQYQKLLSRKKELEILVENYKRKMLRHHYYGTGHLLEAFPRMRHEDYREALEELKKSMREKKEELRSTDRDLQGEK
ncbi:MAG: hypothetical protein LIO92_07315 [Clostridiales bacterium]|nr:hypothetical protein [Clostridiales bacterium]